MRVFVFFLAAVLVAQNAVVADEIDDLVDHLIELMNQPRVNLEAFYANGGTIECDLCVVVKTEVERVITENRDEVEALFYSACDVLPTEYQTNCTSLLDIYLDQLISVVSHMSPRLVCEDLDMCMKIRRDMYVPMSELMEYLRYIQQMSRMTSLQDCRTRAITNHVPNYFLCGACEETLGYVHDFVASYRTWEAVTAFLEPLCDLLPTQSLSECHGIFGQLSGNLEEFADEYLDPPTTCESIGYCQEGRHAELEVTIPEDQDTEVAVDPHIENRSQNSKKKNKKNKKKKKNKKNKKVKTRGERAAVYAAAEREISLIETVAANERCEVCRYYSSAAEMFVQNNEANISDGLTAILQAVCNGMLIDFQPGCRSDIADVLPGVVYQRFVNITRPAHFCTEKIDVCE